MMLLTNDDGINAASLRELKQTLGDIDECFIVAPIDQKSASAHAISLVHDIEVSPYYIGETFFGHQVKGTPADCVKLALCKLMPEPPRLVISGVNGGPNTGVSVYYSGTVSAAREGTIAGIPSIAVSLCSFTSTDFSYACALVKQLAMRIYERGLADGITLNVNIPAIRAEAIKGIKITKQAHSRFVEKYTKKGDRDSTTIYSLSGELELVDDDQNSDEQAVKDGYVSVTPLQLDLTSFSAFEEVEGLL